MCLAAGLENPDIENLAEGCYLPRMLAPLLNGGSHGALLASKHPLENTHRVDYAD